MLSLRSHVLLLLVGLIPVACSAGSDTDDTPATDSGADAPSAAVTDSAPGGLVGGEPRGAAEGSLPRIVFVGTSLTAGLGLGDPLDEAWPAVIGELAADAGTPVEVVNAGVSGATSAGGLSRIDWILREEVDLLVLELGANDGLRGLPVDQLEANLDSILSRVRAARPEARLVLVPMEAPRNLGSDYVDRFRAVFPRVAARWDAEVTPFLLEGVAAVPEMNQSDGIHPTAEGHTRAARNVWPTLRALIEELSARSAASAGGAR